MSERQARAARKAAGWVRHRKQPTPIIDSAYIQAPVGYDDLKKEYRYRSGKQLRRYLARRGIDTVQLEEALNHILDERIALAEAAEKAAEEEDVAAA
jgi:hypothetical protein